MTEQEIVQEFKVLESGSAFISKNIREFEQKYENKFIAVYDNKLIAVASDFNKLKDKIEGEKLNVGMVLIEFIPSKNSIILY
jgi:hypothetical protein